MYNKLLIGVTSLVFSSWAFSGTMGDVSNNTTSLFLSGEGSYTWNEFGNIAVNGIITSPQIDGWGGRLAAGFVKPYRENIRLTGEVGGGYYGTTKYNAVSQNSTSRRTLDGYDALVGAIYSLKNIGILGEIGFMSLNKRFSNQFDVDGLAPGGSFSGFATMNGNQTQILPELKAGLLYDLNMNLALQVSYLHVFGVNPQAETIVSPSNSGYAFNTVNDSRLPTLNSLLFGLRYMFI
jgi:hypothetical protein